MSECLLSVPEHGVARPEPTSRFHPRRPLRGASLFVGAAATLALLGACGDDDVTGGVDAGRTDGGPVGDGGFESDAGPAALVEVTLDSAASGELPRWPAPELVVDDSSTETGVRLAFDLDGYPTIRDEWGGIARTFEEGIPELDGFGVTSTAWFALSAEVEDATGFDGLAETPSAGAGFVVLSEEEPRFISASVSIGARGTTLLIDPQVTLPQQATVAVYFSEGWGSDRGVTPSLPGASAAMRAYIESETEAVAALTELGAIANADELIALSVFPTATITTHAATAAAQIASAPPSFGSPVGCTDTAAFERCELLLAADDFRAPEGHLTAESVASPSSSYMLPVTVWLPLEGSGPFPTVLFGHGLSGGRDQAEQFAVLLAEVNVVTVAIDAPVHNQHPTNPVPGGMNLDILQAFFGIGTVGDVPLVDTLRVRGHFEQAALDKLHVAAALPNADLNGDGNPDVDATQMGYFGVSLGGIMGSQFLALTDAFQSAILSMPGGRLALIASEGEMISPFISVLAPRRVGSEGLERFFPVMQSLLDPGDGASWAPNVLQDRLIAEHTPPSLLIGVSLDDAVVPNSSTYSLARALRVPIAPEVLRSVPGLEEEATSPVVGNRPDGRVAGLLQFDVIGPGVMSQHEELTQSDVAVAAWRAFFEGLWFDGQAEIIDPYEAIGLAHAE